MSQWEKYFVSRDPDTPRTRRAEWRGKSYVHWTVRLRVTDEERLNARDRLQIMEAVYIGLECKPAANADWIITGYVFTTEPLTIRQFRNLFPYGAYLHVNGLTSRRLSYRCIRQVEESPDRFICKGQMPKPPVPSKKTKSFKDYKSVVQDLKNLKGQGEYDNDDDSKYLQIMANGEEEFDIFMMRLTEERDILVAEYRQEVRKRTRENPEFDIRGLKRTRELLDSGHDADESE